MALPQTIDRLETLPELVREHYTQQDGVWTLGLMSTTEHAGLVSALDKERKAHRESESRLAALKTRFEGIDPEEVATLRDQLKAFDDKKVYDDHGLDELVQRRTHEMRTAHERQLAVKDRELTTERDQLQTLNRRWRADRIETALLSAITEAGVDRLAVVDAVARGQRVFTDLDEAGLPIAREGDDIQYGKDGVTPLTPKEFFLTLKTTGLAPHLWPASSGGGAPGYHHGVGGGIDWGKLPPTERLTKFREMTANKP